MSPTVERSPWSERFARLPFARSRVVRQVAVFTFSNGVVGLLGAVSQALLARLLSVPAFGALAFANSFLRLTGSLFEFGLFVPASRLSARAEGADERRRILGAALLAYLPIGIAFCALIFGLSFVVDPIFAVNAGDALRVAAPFALVYPFILISLQLAQGSDRLHVYSITGVLSQLLFVIALIVVAGADLGLSTASALVLRGAAMLVGALVLIMWLRPLFRGARGLIRTLVREAREWGFKVYVGRVLSVGTYNMDVLVLGALTDARSVGFYSLAVAVAYALGLPVTGLASALFPRMARDGVLRTSWLVLAGLSGVVAVVAALLLAGPVIELVFSSSYAYAAELVVPLTLAQTIRGVTSIYNSWFSANRHGRELRNASVVLTVSNLIFVFALIPPFGAMGAAWASVLALAANLAAHVVGYRSAQRRGKGEERA